MLQETAETLAHGADPVALWKGLRVRSSVLTSLTSEARTLTDETSSYLKAMPERLLEMVLLVAQSCRSAWGQSRSQEARQPLAQQLYGPPRTRTEFAAHTATHGDHTQMAAMAWIEVIPQFRTVRTTLWPGDRTHRL